MSVLQMFACEGCGATAEPYDSDVYRIMGTVKPPLDWLVVEGPATDDEAAAVEKSFSNTPKRHACSPACLVDLAQRLAELPNALAPEAEVEA